MAMISVTKITLMVVNNDNSHCDVDDDHTGDGDGDSGDVMVRMVI